MATKTRTTKIKVNAADTLAITSAVRTGVDKSIVVGVGKDKRTYIFRQKDYKAGVVSGPYQDITDLGGKHGFYLAQNAGSPIFDDYVRGIGATPQQAKAVINAIEKFAKTGAAASFRGNLPETPGLVTPEEQTRTVEYLKDAGVLPETEDPGSYPILTAKVKRAVIATLLKARETKLANEVSRWPTQRIRAEKLRQFKVGDMVKYDAKWLRNTGQYTGETGRIKGKVVKFNRMGGAMWPVVQFPKAYDPEPRMIHPNNLRLVGTPEMVN